MLQLLWLVPAIPFLGFLTLALSGSRVSRSLVAWVGVGSVGLSAVFSVFIGARYVFMSDSWEPYYQNLWTWMQISDFTARVSLRLDALSLVMMLVVTGVGFLIHLYSAEFMAPEEGYARFFAYMNLFVGSMLILVLADNLLLLYLGWEGVGLCSYLLIGFWYKDPANGRAARKAFIVTRVGDTAMAIGLFLLFNTLGTLQISDLMRLAVRQYPVGSNVAVAAASLLLLGALGKSAQLPLQTWLPDAMAGPSPVSALIHAATMVTAGVYLIARTHVLFLLAPSVLSLVAAIGAVTLLMAGFSALVQTDIKRVLAYSTISQIGYMFLALGVGAWSAAIFHFMTHAFFKALLFLAAGAVILGVHHEHNMLRMGGLWKRMPLVFWTFLIGACSLAALPLVTAGYFSKDMIIWESLSSVRGSRWLFVFALGGAFLTSVYTFRMVCLTFFGEAKTEPNPSLGWRIKIPLVALAVLSIIGGYVELPRTLGHFQPFSHFMRSVLPGIRLAIHDHSIEVMAAIVAGFVSIGGIGVAYWAFLVNPKAMESLARRPGVSHLREWWRRGWGFDWLYDGLFVRPYCWIARVNSKDFFDGIFMIIKALALFLYWILHRLQNGKLRWYATGIAGGAVILILLVVVSWY